MTRLRVLYRGPVCQPTGYGQAAHDYIMALLTADVDVRVEPILDGDTDALPARYERIKSTIGHAPAPTWPTHVIIHTIPKYAHEFVGGGRMLGPRAALPSHVQKICITTWETSRLPDEIRATLWKYFDTIVVPSRFVAEAIDGDWRLNRESGRVHVVPHAYDPKWWHASAPERPAGPYTFYSIGVGGTRKNLGGLLIAYLSEFTAADDVTLKLVTSDTVAEGIPWLASTMNLDVAQLPKVEVLKRLTDTELRHLHMTADCYVTMARGEGWGLGAFEAAIVGNPVIWPTHGGLVDFLHDYLRGHPVGYLKTPVVRFEVRTLRSDGMDCTQSWAEPDLIGCKSAMRHLFERGLQARETRHQANFAVRYGYEAVGQQLLSVLNRGWGT